MHAFFNQLWENVIYNYTHCTQQTDLIQFLPNIPFYIYQPFSFLGNVFVIAAIILERNLQSVANYLILSLAVADLLVAVLVMPLGAIYEVNFGSKLNRCYAVYL